MPGHVEISVDPPALVDAVCEAGAAVTGLAAARQVLDEVNDRLQDGAVLHQDGDADHKISTFTRQWREELELIAGMLEHLDEALRGAADAYASADEEFDRALRDAIP